jgi:microcompartment protein CcmL/EutN
MKKAIGMVEVASIPQGIGAADAMLKAGSVELLQALPVCPGKYLVLISGDVGAVKTAVRAGAAAAGHALIDTLVLPNVHDSLPAAVAGAINPAEPEALGVIETLSCPSALIVGDTAAKAADVDLVEVRLARGLGGKCFVTLTGDVGAVKAAIRAAEAAIAESGLHSGSIVLPAPHEALWRHVL